MITWCKLFGISEQLNMSGFPTSCRQIVDMLQYGGDDSSLFYMYAMWIKYISSLQYIENRCIIIDVIRKEVRRWKIGYGKHFSCYSVYYSQQQSI